MNKELFDSNNRIIIEDYHKNKPFSSFLAGVAGTKGIPMWAFYVNRGQAICSFGVRDKNSSIMEFSPAYKSYEVVENTGFRTFVKTLNGKDKSFYEPFINDEKADNVQRNLFVGPNDIELEEINSEQGLKFNVSYFTLPEENFAALVRTIEIENISNEYKELEVIDGAPIILPYGFENAAVKEVGNTLKAWAHVSNEENRIPLYKVSSSTNDSAEVSEINKAHFYAAFSMGKNNLELLTPIYDMEVIFGQNTSLRFPKEFFNNSLAKIVNEKQVYTNKMPGAFAGVSKKINPGEKIVITSYIGHIDNINKIEDVKKKISRVGFLEEKKNRTREIIEDITEDISVKTSSKIFDEYCKQTYLDNVLRGGYPIVIDGCSKSPKVYHVYSRKHGDLERDYNFFSTQPEYYSCGNGNFRDVNQNRRCDVYFNPKIKDFNIRTFMELIQIDGYNPLVLNSYKFVYEKDIEDLKKYFIKEDEFKKIANLLNNKFSLGDIYRVIEESNMQLFGSSQESFIWMVVKDSKQEIEAMFGEGYWVDHWTYNLDLIESFLDIYPEEKSNLLFISECNYFDDDAIVKKREEKYVCNNGKIRQYDALTHNKEKQILISSRDKYKNLLRTKQGVGSIYSSNILEKLVVLAVNKYSSLDPKGVGISMEAGKPGWNDALNGLPGIFGSSVADSYELVRLIDFILASCYEFKGKEIKLPIEVNKLMNSIKEEIEKYNLSTETTKNFICWSNVNEAKEEFRDSILFGIDGEEKNLKVEELAEILKIMQDKLEAAINEAIKENDGIYPTYFYYEAEDYKFITDDQGNSKLNIGGYPLVKVNDFAQRKLPLFLEGVVRGLKIEKNKEKGEEVVKKVRQSELFDKKLKMYKLNASLEKESFELGRLRAFTPGWFENETIWVHMEYKYLLEVLRYGLYDEFFKDMKNILIPFLDMNVYGRSILENSSFIASSANPDEKTHGVGYVARLSGATAEFLSMWQYMLVGQSPFLMEQGELNLKFAPVIPGWLFDEDGRVNFNFLSNIKVSYYNPKKADTTKLKINKIVLNYKDGGEVILNSELIPNPYASDVRNNLVNEIKINLA